MELVSIIFPIIEMKLGFLLTFFPTGFVQIGALNEVHHLWQFPDLEERRARREQSWSVSGYVSLHPTSPNVTNNLDSWAETVHRTVPLIQTMRSHIMVPMPWSPVG